MTTAIIALFQKHKIGFYAADVKSETVKTNKKCTLYKEDNIAKGSIANLKSEQKLYL